MAVSILPSPTDCPYCDDPGYQTPVEIYNRPGLAALAYRVGTAEQFKRTMLARLSQSGLPALWRLTTRDDDDFTVALLDAWATVADVLSFYQERIANESYLRTGTERLSLLELARLIGYEPAPGVAASTYMAFTLEEPPAPPTGAARPDPTAPPLVVPPATIDKGTKIQSVPDPGEEAQTFETIEEMVAYPGRHQMRPRPARPQKICRGMKQVHLRGTATNLARGDLVLIIANSSPPVSPADKNWEVRTIEAVTLDEDNGTTCIALSARKDSVVPGSQENSNGQSQTWTIDDFWAAAQLDSTAQFGEEVVAKILEKSWEQANLVALLKMKGWSVADCIANINRQILALETRSEQEEGAVLAFRTHACLFGYNAPKNVTFPSSPPYSPPSFHEWDLQQEDKVTNVIYLDHEYGGIAPGSLVLIQKGDENIENAQLNQVSRVETRSRTAYGVSSKTTCLELARPLPPEWYPGNNKLAVLRNVTVHLLSEALPLAQEPITDSIQKTKKVTLDRCYEGLVEGQRVVVTGQAKDLAGVFTGEVMTLMPPSVNKGFTELTFTEALSHEYERNSVNIHANVALATHGETVQEVLGSGDASQSFQRFSLRQRPLTHVSAATPSGTETTLEVRVNDVLWREVSTLHGQSADARVYVTRTDDDGKTTVVFGDGRTGARLPTGRENIKARYRKGIGLGGQVKANQLSQLITKPLGVKSATNPLPSDGAAAPESLTQIRRNAPVTVLTLDRIVSLQDYQDFARAFTGIDKALATWDYQGTDRAVFLTVAGTDGAAVVEGSNLYEKLTEALSQAGNPRIPVHVVSYQPRFFQIQAKIQVAADHLAEKVLAAVERELRTRFSFHARQFGQGVTLSEVISAMQQVEGVQAVDLDGLVYSEEKEDTELSEPPPHLTAASSYFEEGKLLGAELLTLDSRPVALEEMK